MAFNFLVCFGQSPRNDGTAKNRQFEPTVGLSQMHPSRKGGLVPSKILFNFAAVTLVPAAVGTRDCKRSRHHHEVIIKK